jgi:hypothetical protein
MHDDKWWARFSAQVWNEVSNEVQPELDHRFSPCFSQLVLHHASHDGENARVRTDGRSWAISSMSATC